MYAIIYIQLGYTIIFDREEYRFSLLYTFIHYFIINIAISIKNIHILISYIKKR